MRSVVAAYGNDPTNWFAWTPTPGVTNYYKDADFDGDGLPDAWEIAYGLDPLHHRRAGGRTRAILLNVGSLILCRHREPRTANREPRWSH